jgi:hypothetical protein
VTRTLAALLVAALPLQENLEERRDALAARLEAVRGLRFKKPLGIREGTRREYAAHVLDNARRAYGGDLAAAEKGLKALGFFPARLRLELALTLHAGLGVKVFCSGGEIVLLDRQAGDEWILNKMDLGLVDQHYAPEVAPTYDAQMAFAALRLGDAEVVKHRFRHPEKFPADYLAEVHRQVEAWEREESRLASMVVPRFFVRSADFPWRRGAVFALTLYRDGGFRRLDEAFGRPPVSTEQILHPEKYLKGEPPVDIDCSPAEGFLVSRGYRMAYRTVLGELGATLFLETHLPRHDPGGAGAGWGGDTLVVFEKEDAPALILWATEWDTEAQAAAFEKEAAEALRAWGEAPPGTIRSTARRKTSVPLLLSVPEAWAGDLLEEVWKSARRRGPKRETYGE